MKIPCTNILLPTVPKSVPDIAEINIVNNSSDCIF